MPSVGKLSRRKLAVLIRVRQELHKRLDAVRPGDRADQPVAHLFDRAMAADVEASGGNRRLCDLLRGRFWMIQFVYQFNVKAGHARQALNL